MSTHGCYASRDKFPCRGCVERRTCCHDKCERYQEAKTRNDARKAIEREKRMTIGAANEYTIKQAARVCRKKLPQR